MRPNAAGHSAAYHALSVFAIFLIGSALIGAGNLYAKGIICITTTTSFSPPGGCNTGQGGQPLTHNVRCSCSKVVKNYVDSDTKNTIYTDMYITCDPVIVTAGGPTVSSTAYSGFEQMVVNFKQQPTGPVRPPRFLRCENGFADLRDSSGKPFEPVGPCGGGNWTIQLPEKSFEVRMNGLHYPQISDCVLAKQSYLSNFQQNVPLKNLCKAQDQTAVPASILRIDCTPGTKANGFIGGSVVGVVVTCQGS
jgi:hypothetical protein